MAKNREKIEPHSEKQEAASQQEQFDSRYSSLSQKMRETEKQGPTSSFDKETAKEAKMFLQKSYDKEFDDFKRSFVESHEEELKEKGIFSPSKDKKYISQAFSELEGIKFLMESEECEKERENLDNLTRLQKEFDEKEVTLDASYSLLHKVGELINQKKWEILQDPANLAIKEGNEQQIKNLYSFSEKIYKEITGENPRQEEAEKYSSRNAQAKESYLNDNLRVKIEANTLREENRNGNIVELSLEETLQKLGYKFDRKNRGWAGLKRGSLFVYKENDEDNSFKFNLGVRGKPKGEYEKALQELLEAEAKNRLEQGWDQETKKIEDAVEESARGKIDDLAFSPELTEEKIAERYERIRQKQIKKEKQRKISKKTPEEKTATQKDYGKHQKGVDQNKINQEIIESKGDFSKLKGDIEEDAETIDSFLEKMGLEINTQNMEDYKDYLGEYNQSFKNPKKRASWFWGLFGILSAASQELAGRNKKM